MQIRLHEQNAKLLRDLMKAYVKICPDYSISATQQVNLLFRSAVLSAMEQVKDKKVVPMYCYSNEHAQP